MMFDTIQCEWLCGESSCLRIENFLKQVDKDFYPKLSSRVDIEVYAYKLANNAKNLFAVIDGIDVGACSVYCNYKEAYITSIAVKSSYRNNGIGNKIMAEVKEYISEKGISKIGLQVYKANHGAIKYYIQNGFIKVSEDGNWINMICTMV